MLPELKEYVTTHFNAPARALDLGCGDGSDIRGLEELGWQCEGVDIATTGTDLNEPYLSPKAPFDFVYSNYVIQKLKSPSSLIKTIEDNLALGGQFFLHTFTPEDEYARKSFSPDDIQKLLSSTGLVIDSIKTSKIWDDEPGHDHYHHIIQVSGHKPL